MGRGLFATMLPVLGLLLLSAPAVQAQGCWWSPEGFRCHPGWYQHEGRSWSEQGWREREHIRHEEWKRRHDPDWAWRRGGW